MRRAAALLGLVWLLAAPASTAGCGRDEVRAARGEAFKRVPILSPASTSERQGGSFDDPAEAGFRVFARTCVTCHQPSGMGMPNAFPPLARSDFLAADKGRSVSIVLGGIEGPITVNGKPYSASMPSFAALSDDDIAGVLTFVRSSWGNAGEPVTREEVASRRARGTAPVTVAAAP
jgi:nitrite reductase (NO-forming)